MGNKLLDIYSDYLIYQNKYTTAIAQVLTKFFLLPKLPYTKFDRLIRKLSKFYPNFFIFGSGFVVTFLCRAEIFAISICSSS